MSRRILLAMAMLAATAPAAAAATAAVATANVNLRAGPSTGYPVITVLPTGARIVTHGCLADYSWCDIAFGQHRGWVSAGYVQVVHGGGPVVLTPAVAPAVGVTVVSFNKVYWDTYYAAYPWYGSWNRYGTYYRAYPAGRVTSHHGSAGCVDGRCTATRSTTGIYGGSASHTRTCSGGNCSATRDVVGPYGNNASRTRNCSANDRSCTMTRTGPRGGTATGTRVFAR